MQKTILTGLLALAALLPVSGCAPLLVGGAGAGALMVEDRRTPATYLMDQEIELRARWRLSEQKLEGTHINFTSFNRRLLITGEAATADLRARIVQLAREVPDVREVLDEIVVAAPTSFMSRSNDTLLTAKVKTRLVDDDQVRAHHVKVITENGAVFLMGLVKREDGNRAAEIAAKTSGVIRVVKAFELLD